MGRAHVSMMPRGWIRGVSDGRGCDLLSRVSVTAVDLRACNDRILYDRYHPNRNKQLQIA